MKILSKYKVGDKIMYNKEESEVVATYDQNNIIFYIVKYSHGWTVEANNKKLLTGCLILGNNYHYAYDSSLTFIESSIINNTYSIF